MQQNPETPVWNSGITYLVFTLTAGCCSASLAMCARHDILESTELATLPPTHISIVSPAIPLCQRKATVLARDDRYNVLLPKLALTRTTLAFASQHICFWTESCWPSVEWDSQSWCELGQHRTDTHVTLQHPRARLEGQTTRVHSWRLILRVWNLKCAYIQSCCKVSRSSKMILVWTIRRTQ